MPPQQPEPAAVAPSTAAAEYVQAESPTVVPQTPEFEIGNRVRVANVKEVKRHLRGITGHVTRVKRKDEGCIYNVAFEVGRRGGGTF